MINWIHIKNFRALNCAANETCTKSDRSVGLYVRVWSTSPTICQVCVDSSLPAVIKDTCIRLWCKRSCILHISNTVKRNQNPFEVTCRRHQFFRKSTQERPSRLSRRREARYPRHRYGADLHNDSCLFVAKRCVTVGR